MSLFNTLDLWRAKAGEGETFGFHSLVVGKLDQSEHDEVICGSFDGVLRIYRVSCDQPEQSSSKPSDLLLETQLSESICQIVVGKLVSGSKAAHIGVVHPRTISVYGFTAIPGSVEHGRQFDLKLIYEHPLQRYNYQVVIGPFGAVRGRDFLCAVALDGTLSFFEQETFVHEAQLPAFLLPSPITYVAETDSFITLTKNRCIAAYKYQDLVTTKKKVAATWSYNLGETLLDIQTRRYTQQETYLVALSEHNVTCFNAGGLLKFTSRLQYTPLCFYTYINEYNNNFMMLIVSDSGTVFIYERCTLRWSAKLSIIPLCILRVNLEIDGALVLLSEKGDLNCCFLGTRPTLFVAPPLENSITNFKHVGRKLESLQNKIRDFKKNNKNSSLLSLNEQEISVVFKLLPYDKLLNHCQLDLELKSTRPLSDIRVSFEISQPAQVQPASYTVCTLYEQVNYTPVIEIGAYTDIIVSRLDVTAVVYYKGTNVPRIIRRSICIWPKFVLLPYAAANSDDKFSLKLCVNTSETPPSLLTLFQDLRDDQWTDDETIGFCLRYNSNVKCVISALKTSCGFIVTGNSAAMIYLMVSQLVQRCRKHNGQVSFEIRENVPKEELFEAVGEYAIARNKITELEGLLEKLCAQYRLIQRRMFVKVKDKTPSNLTSLRVLYASTHEKLLETINLLEDGQKNLLVKLYSLQGIVDLTFELISMKEDVSRENASKLKTAMTTSFSNSNSRDWSERTMANVTYLLQTSLSNSKQDQRQLSSLGDQVSADPTELVRVITIALNRLLRVQSAGDTATSTLNTKNDQQRAVSPIPELEENDDVHSSKLPSFINREKLLKKRHVVEY